MTKEAALFKFFNSFAIPAYPATAVPEDTTFPWITYEPVVGYNGDELSMTVNIWYYSTDEAPANAKARELGNAIGLGGTQLICDEGIIWLKRGSPWCQTILDESDTNIKRRYINVTAEYITID